MAQFQRIATKIVQDLIPKRCGVFVDDIGVKGPKTKYGNEEALLGIRRYVLEHIVNINQVLTNVELAGAVISGAKSQFCILSIKLVGFICDSDGRHPDHTKVLTILE